MANVKISNLTSGSVPTALDIIPIVDYETLSTRGVRASHLAAYITSSITVLPQLTISGNLNVTNSFTASNFNISGNIINSFNGLPTFDGDNRVIIQVGDMSSYNLGVGAGFTFAGKFNSAGTLAGFAGIKGIKENAVDGDLNAALVFMTRKTGELMQEKMRLTSQGRLGLGSISNPSASLHIESSSVDPVGLIVKNLSTGNNTTAYMEISGGSGPNVNILSRTTLTLAAGHGGVGFTNDSDGTNQLVFQALNSTLTPTTKRFKFSQRPYFTTDSLNLFSDAIETDGGIMTWNRTGSVGIGVAVPYQRLHVNGNVYVNNSITSSGLTVNTTAAVEKVVILGGSGVDEPGVSVQGPSGADSYPQLLLKNSAGASHWVWYAHTPSSNNQSNMAFNDAVASIDRMTFASQITATGAGWSVPRVIFNTGNGGLNGTGADFDFQVKGDNDNHTLFVDASTDSVGIGTDIPTQKLHVNGNVNINNSLTGTLFTASVGAAGLNLRAPLFGYLNLVNYLTGNYILQATDAGKTLTFNMPTVQSLIIPTGLPNGYGITLAQTGLGAVFVTGSVGVTLRNRLNHSASAGQYSVIGLTHLSGNIFLLGGDTA